MDINRDIFVKYNNADEKRDAFRKALNSRNEWEKKMKILLQTNSTPLSV